MGIMKKIITVLTLFSTISLFGFTPLDNDECLNCHDALGDEPSQLFKNDIHYLNGISCKGCHGGDNKTDDMDAAMNKKAGFIGVPKGNEISERCSTCHSDPEFMKKYNKNLPVNQMALLKNSVHGGLALNGKERIVQCTTCHGAHGIISVKNHSSPVYPLNIPRTCAKCHSNAVLMREYNPSLPVDQLDKYRTSIHGIRNGKGDPRTAECVSCHGSHDILPVKDANSNVYPINLPKTCAKCHSNADYMREYKIPVQQYEKFSMSVHGIALLQNKDLSAPSCNSCHGNHGAVPPGVESISKVCGTCHVLNADLFSSSPHKKAFDEHNYPECETCHSNHLIISATDKLLGVTKEAVCSRCHSENENVKGYRVAKEMRLLMDSLDHSEELAKNLVNEAEQKGMEISEAKFKLRDAHQAKLQARTMVHSFNEGKFKEIVDGKGLATTNEIIAEANNAIDEFYFRRIGLGISVLVISFLALMIFLYIRRMERSKKSEK
jgi:predicted CXXCH cytochrome family protein